MHISARRIWLARSIAVAADMMQLLMFPAFGEGLFSPLADGLDLFVGLTLTFLLGWHIAFIPSFIIKLLPVADLAPTWSIAVLIATRGWKAQPIDQDLPLLDAKNPPVD